ncbi:MAG: ATP-binding protein [candidate division KSB1 bacterium]|nr:ATP-binding protein [candidate division KSB1 bacterium]MDZ7368929.1 ATP-binding protein [candidate division KSB1 bacterium]MDZ7406917.1 ATP-binding protein [candidate division KSB1 bacterium]
MFDSFLKGAEAFTLDASASATILSIAAFLALFATALAERAYRLQSLGVLAGLSAVMLLTTIFILVTIGHALLGLAWVQQLFGGELFFYLFCLGTCGLWFAAAVSPSRLAEPRQSRRIFFRWQLVCWAMVALITLCGAVEGYGIFHFPLNEALRQIFAGIAAGIFLIAAGIALYRLWRERAALWFWLALASLIFAGGVSFFYFARQQPLVAYAIFGFAVFLVIAALFADHVRFLRLESELRTGLLENTIKLEDENQRQAAILEFTREAVLHLDRDERATYVNLQFLQFMKTVGALGAAKSAQTVDSKKTLSTPQNESADSLNAAAVIGRKLSSLLPRELFEKLLPSAQEARRGRSSLVEIHHIIADEEKFLQIFAAPLQDKYEKIFGVHLSVLDLTARHLAARSLEDIVAEKTKDLHIFQQCVENAMDAIVITDTANKILYVNEAFERITGFARSEMIGRTPQFYHDEGEAGRWNEINRRLIQHKSWRGEMVSRRQDGGEFISDLSVIPIAGADEKIIRYLWIERDATARKELEEKLRLQAEELEAKTAEIVRSKQHQASLQGRTGELQRRIDQLAKLMEIGEDIRLNVGLDLIMQKVSEAAAALGWQCVLILQRRENEVFQLVAQSGFANRNAPSLRPMQQIPYSELAPYLLERFRLSESFFIDSRQWTGGRPIFIPASLEVPTNGDWLPNDGLLVPIRSRDQLIGLIIVFNPSEGYRPNLQQVRDLEILADDAAIAIENSRLLALHQRNERQARVLADIGKAFRVAGTVEQVVTEIAGIGVQAFSRPCLVLVQPFGERRWLCALGTTTSRSDRPKSRLLDSNEFSETLLPRFTTTTTADIVQIDLSQAELPPSILAEVVKIKSSEPLLALKDNNRPVAKAQLVSMRSRGRSIGVMAYLLPEGVSDSIFQHPNDADFAADIADRAALIIENAHLFHETDEKAMALERANQLISEFLASVSHELRTPMHSILQFSEILLSETPGKLNPEQKRQLTVVQRSGKNLLRLLNDILDLSKIEAGKMEAVIEEFAPAQIIREATESIRPLCEQKKLALRVRLGENLPERFRCDRSILSRVLTNLLGNAVKFTEKGEIEVWARARSNTLVISVRDTGIGISSSKQKEIFEPFRQLENSETRRHGGTGLGLAISKKMLMILNGDIEVESEPGKGSKFTIHIPPSTAPVRAVVRSSRAEKARAGGESKSKGVDGKAAAKKRGRLSLRFPLSHRPKSPRILVIEDDENTRYAMQFILENAGYKVEFAEAGDKALLAAQHQRPDLILMDIMMPNMDGYQVARMLKAQKQLAHIPVVALTARAMKGDREKALAAGCNDYLTKPFESKDILGMLEKWLGNGV